MRNDQWTFTTALQYIRKAKGKFEVFRSRETGEIVQINIFPPRKTSLKIWGCLDYLKNYCGAIIWM